MKKHIPAALAALAIAAIIPSSSHADNPVNPVPGAVCNLYNIEWSGEEEFIEHTANLADQPAVATIADSAGDFLAFEKKDKMETNIGMWTGWFKQEKAGKFTFLCQQYDHEDNFYSIWINGEKCIEGGAGQKTFNVNLLAGFNSVTIIVSDSDSYGKNPLTITYRKAGSLKEPIPFGPGNMFHEDEE